LLDGFEGTVAVHGRRGLPRTTDTLIDAPIQVARVGITNLQGMRCRHDSGDHKFFLLYLAVSWVERQDR
jgi:hypothetical protein